eukprot:122163-Rhodomonas_salina.2
MESECSNLRAGRRLTALLLDFGTRGTRVPGDPRTRVPEYRIKLITKHVSPVSHNCEIGVRTPLQNQMENLSSRYNLPQRNGAFGI